MKPACHGVICRADEAGSRLSLHVPSGALHLFRHLLSGICIKIVTLPGILWTQWTEWTQKSKVAYIVLGSYLWQFRAMAG